MSDTPTSSTCYRFTCGAVEPGVHSVCPRCGGRMKSDRTVRTLGWVMVAIGVFLVGLMLVIINAIGPALTAAMAGSGVAADGSSFKASPDAARGVMRLLWVIVGFGLLDLVNGLYQALSGRRSKVMNILLLLAALGIGYCAFTAVQGL